jgi:hypothetical protein
MATQSIPPAIAQIAPDGNLTPRQMRHILIEISRRRVHPGTGSSAEFMLRRTAMHQWPDFRSILLGIDWVIIGGVATRAYMPERVTKDLDILVRATDGSEVIERLKRAGYTVVSRRAVPGYLMRSPDGVEVDVLFGRYSWLAEAFAQVRYDQAGYPIISLPFLVLLKLAANRGRDVGDMTTMLGWASTEDLDRVRAAVARYSPEDSDDLESLIFIGQKERELPPDAD